MMKTVDVAQGILLAVVTICVYLWLRTKFARSPSAAQLRPEPHAEPESTGDGPAQPSEQKQGIPLDRADTPSIRQGQTETSFGPKVNDYPNTTVATDHGRSDSGQHRLPKGGRTFRVRGVPCGWNRALLESFLAEQGESAGPAVRSLAREIHGRSQTATVAFEKVSPRLQALPPGPPWQIHLPAATGPSARSHSLALDHGFLGITTLYAPPSQDHKVESVTW
jgi:hypothetical protein